MLINKYLPIWWLCVDLASASVTAPTLRQKFDSTQNQANEAKPQANQAKPHQVSVKQEKPRPINFNGSGHVNSHVVHVQLTQSKLADFTHRGGLHVDRVELRSEPNDRNAFFIHNPTDPSYPLWAAARASVAQVWPRPRYESRRQQQHRPRMARRTLRIAPQLRLRLDGSAETDSVCQLAAARFARRAFADVAAISDSLEDAEAARAPSGLAIDSLLISVRNGTFLRYPHLDMREDYEVTVNATGITLTAQENWGVLRGLETIAQLIFVSRTRPDRLLIHENRIEDRPAYKHRGFMMDTARHFIQKSTLLENLEAMAMNKMNVFHWHMVDDQSFPYLSKKFPQFVQKSAFPGGRYYYTAEDIAEIVEFARQRGIRVVPEFDTPDHTHSWGHAAPDLVSWCSKAGLAYSGPLDPTRPGTFQFLAELYSELAELFPDSSVHLGMDEVSLDCWRLNDSVSKFMRENKMTAHEQLVVYFANRLSGIVENLPVRRSVVVWEDILDKDSSLYPLNLPKDAIVQVWITRDSAKLDRWRQRYRLIRSEDWYLDHRGYGADWVKRYRFHPGPDDLGGEACLWTEFQSDNTVMPRAWPSTSAVAERLWSGEAATEPVEAAPRIEEQNCRMMIRGIRVGVAGGPSMCQTPLLPRLPDWQRPPDTASKDRSLGSEVLMSFSPGSSGQCWFYKWACIAMFTVYTLSKLLTRKQQQQPHLYNRQRLSQLLGLLRRGPLWLWMKLLTLNEGVLLLLLLAAYLLGWIVTQLLVI
ncbi:hypothetical protein BOX15_Mlig033111g1 [Macrostomum lignano]|uniref:beta-N-acetylhexosaminidase n=1 Tax=Macrostomum lignano TaxID=282301 RepID=A0A267EV81_9PLAT|nr:hypothetical protein BOX15_Mlig033111g1 [Macrostomum lignano]